VAISQNSPSLINSAVAVLPGQWNYGGLVIKIVMPSSERVAEPVPDKRDFRKLAWFQYLTFRKRDFAGLMGFPPQT
jgi:hypothetical protein